MPATQTPELVQDEKGTTYEVVYSSEVSEQMRQGGCVWTHFLGLKRPAGSCSYVMWANINEAGEITRRSRTTKAF